MTSLNTMKLPELYKQVNRTIENGVAGYYVPKKYQDPLLQMKTRQLAQIPKGQKSRKHQTKRGSYLEDQFKLHKGVPGPGVYKSQQKLWPEKSQNLHHEGKKETFIEQIIKRQNKEKKPAPGQYDVIKTLKQLEAEKKKMAQKRIPVQDRIFYLDEVQYQSNQLPGPGMYNARSRIQTQPTTALKLKPQQWRKKHQQQQKKHNKPKKEPDMGTYNPQSSDVRLFSANLTHSKSSNMISKLERFKTISTGYNIGPGKYLALQRWKNKQKKSSERNGLDSISKGPSKSVYYN